jgi:glycosyltransferase involved in cell wall biosynthesis
MRLRRQEGVHWVGSVDEQLKWDALAACDVVVVPSRYESLSLTALEAWCMGKPVLANAHAACVVGQCRRAQGGLWYANADELAVALDLLDDRLREQLGRQGRAFVAANYSWGPVLDTYRAALGTSPA